MIVRHNLAILIVLAVQDFFLLSIQSLAKEGSHDVAVCDEEDLLIGLEVSAYLFNLFIEEIFKLKDSQIEVIAGFNHVVRILMYVLDTHINMMLFPALVQEEISLFLIGN
jgi:hypothetical protein